MRRTTSSIAAVLTLAGMTAFSVSIAFAAEAAPAGQDDAASELPADPHGKLNPSTSAPRNPNDPNADDATLQTRDDPGGTRRDYKDDGAAGGAASRPDDAKK